MLTNRNFSDLFHRTGNKHPKKVRLSADFCLFSRFGIGPSIWLAQYKASNNEFHKSLTIIRRDLSPKNEETLFMNIYTYTYQGQLTDHIIGGIRKGGGWGVGRCPDSTVSCTKSVKYTHITQVVNRRRVGQEDYRNIWLYIYSTCKSMPYSLTTYVHVFNFFFFI